ncbi:unnamed protein product, partial [Laminaria digitata]
MPHAFLVVLGIILAGLILLVDLITSAESINPGKFSYVVGGVPYVAVVLTTLWMPGRSYTIVFAILSSFLTLSVLFFEAETIAAAPWLSLSFQPESLNVGLGSPVVNRTLAVFAIWITAILTIQRKS